MLWITRPVTIRGISADQISLHLNAAVISVNHSSENHVTFSKITLSGDIYVGDAELILEYVVLKDAVIMQESFRGYDISKVMLLFMGCIVTDSVIANQPSCRPSVSTYNVNYTSLIGYGSEFTRTNINVSSIYINVRVESSNISDSAPFTSDSESQPCHSGLFVNPGVHLGRNKAQLQKRDTRGLDYETDDDIASDDETELGSGDAHVDYESDGYLPARRKRDISQQEIYTNNILIVGTNITNTLSPRVSYPLSAVMIRSTSDFKVEVYDSIFEGNSRGLDISFVKGDQASVLVSGCKFERNVAAGPGGGLQVDQLVGKLFIMINNTLFTSNMALGWHTTNDDVTARVSQITGSGGALGLHVTPDGGHCRAVIQQCLFDNNTAEDYGGSIYITDGVNARILDNHFKNIKPNVTVRPRMGELLEFRGNIYNENNTFSVQSAREDIPVIAYRAASDGSFMETKELKFICPAGYRAKAVYSAVNLTPRRTSIETLLMYCKPCLEGEYTLDLSAVYVDQTSGLRVSQLSNASCLKCPYGAWCTNDVRAKANFWGEVHEGQVFMYLCPEGYCCQDQTCQSYDVCAPHRTGTLCGHCERGYSESVLDNECIEDSKCTWRSTFWAVVATYGFLYVLFFVMEEECQVNIVGFLSWAVDGFNRCRGKPHKSAALNNSRVVQQSSPEEGMELRNTNGTQLSNKKRMPLAKTPAVRDTDNDSSDASEEGKGAYVQIFMYFIQISSLTTIDILYKNDRDQPMQYLARLIPNALSFKSFALDINTCLFSGMTPVYNAWLKTGFVLYLFVVWFLLFLVALFVNWVCGRCCQRPSWIAKITLKARFVTALFNLLLFTYQVLAEKALLLLKCIDIKSQTNTVLFIDANVTCYQDWQWYVLLFALSYVFPFCLVLTYAPNLLGRRIISIKTSIICIVFPLFSAPVLIFWFYRHKNKPRPIVDKRLSPSVSIRRMSIKYDPAEDNDKDKLKGTVESVVALISDPYRQDLWGGLCWEGMIAFRRLVLVCLATFIYNVLTRHILIVTVCFFSLLFHYRLAPFLHKNCNYLENVSLTVLVFISVMNLLKAVYFEAGNIPDGTPDRLFMYYDWVEGVLVGVLPLLAVLLVGVVIGLRIIVFLFSCGMKLCTKYSKWWHVALTWLNVIKCINDTVKKMMTRQTLCRIIQNFVYYHSVLTWCFPVDIASRVDDAAWWCGISGAVRLKWYKHKFVNPVRCRYQAVNFLQNLHNRRPIARLWGRGMGRLLWV